MSFYAQVMEKVECLLVWLCEAFEGVSDPGMANFDETVFSLCFFLRKIPNQVAVRVW